MWNATERPGGRDWDTKSICRFLESIGVASSMTGSDDDFTVPAQLPTYQLINIIFHHCPSKGLTSFCTAGTAAASVTAQNQDIDTAIFVSSENCPHVGKASDVMIFIVLVNPGKVIAWVGIVGDEGNFSLGQIVCLRALGSLLKVEESKLGYACPEDVA